MKFTEIKDLSLSELKKQKAALKQSLFDAKIKNQLGQLGNPLEIRKLRKDLARISTAMVQKVVR